MPVAKSRYFLIVSVVMLALVFAGFAPTFYLRSFFDIPDPVAGPGLPVHIILHGLAMTAWYTLLCVQSWLITARRTSMHRTLGIAGAVTSVAVVVSGFTVLANDYSRRMAAGVEIPAEDHEFYRDIIISQTFNLTVFLLCVGTAIYFRNKGEIHKRLMLLCSILIIGAALTTARTFPAFLQEFLPVPVAPTINFLLLGSLLGFDFLKHRKVFMLSAIGALVILVIRPNLVAAFVHSQAGMAFTFWLSEIPY